MKNPAALKTLLEDRIRDIREQPAWEHPMYAPIAYIMGLGGKRIRPLLLLMTYQALSEDSVEKALDAATSVEVFHNFTLVHDDIMDNAPVRRGQATVHEKWDENIAILAGDAMFGVALDLLVRGFPEKAGALTREFSRVSIGVCEGQMEDMLMAGSETVGIPDYLEMIRKKTAMLIGGAMSLGGIAAGASQAVVDQLYAYGEAMGMGFQLQDDYLDVYAEQTKFGKQVAGDILENKMTYLLLKAIEKADPQQQKTLEKLLYDTPDPDAKVAGVRAIYEAVDIQGETRRAMATYFDKARDLGTELRRFDGFVFVDEFLGAVMKRDF